MPLYFCVYSSALPLLCFTGVAYTSECFPCKPGTFSDKPGSSNCQVCPRNTYSEKGAKECTKCKEATHYAGTWQEMNKIHEYVSVWDSSQLYKLVCRSAFAQELLYLPLKCSQVGWDTKRRLIQCLFRFWGGEFLLVAYNGPTVEDGQGTSILQKKGTWALQ